MQLMYSTLVLIMILISVQIFIVRTKDSKEDWYADRHKNSNTKKFQNVLKISGEGPDKGKPVTVANCGHNGLSVNIRIVGGKLAAFGEFPWVVLILSLGTPFCGGAILNERWIITAAHCFKDRTDAKGLTIKVGMIDNEIGTEYEVSKFIQNTRYNSDNMEVADIALVKTSKPIQMERSKNINTINGICLPDRFDEPRAKWLTVVGWGRTSEDGDASRYLRQVNLDIMNESTCKKKFRVPMEGYPKGFRIYKSQICTFTVNKDSCQGDSGGPAIEMVEGKAVLVGVISFGVGCATDFPGFFFKVYSFRCCSCALSSDNIIVD